MASVRAGRPTPASCDASDDAEGVEPQTRQMIEWAMTGFLPNGPQSLDPREGIHTGLTFYLIKHTLDIHFVITYSKFHLIMEQVYKDKKIKPWPVL